MARLTIIRKLSVMQFSCFLYCFFCLFDAFKRAYLNNLMVTFKSRSPRLVLLIPYNTLHSAGVSGWFFGIPAVLRLSAFSEVFHPIIRSVAVYMIHVIGHIAIMKKKNKSMFKIKLLIYPYYSAIIRCATGRFSYVNSWVNSFIPVKIAFFVIKKKLQVVLRHKCLLSINPNKMIYSC